MKVNRNVFWSYNKFFSWKRFTNCWNSRVYLEDLYFHLTGKFSISPFWKVPLRSVHPWHQSSHLLEAPSQLLLIILKVISTLVSAALGLLSSPYSSIWNNKIQNKNDFELLSICWINQAKTGCSFFNLIMM